LQTGIPSTSPTMVEVGSEFPEFVRQADAETYIELADPPADVRSRLRQADRDTRIRLLARGWLNRFHGSRHEAKKLFVLFMNENDIPFAGEDVQAITEDPPVDTQT
jgi:hypothetical protein